MDVAFIAISLVHVLVWAFVMLAWLHPQAAALNLLVVIPAIYVLHMLPFHTINSLKQRMHPGTWQADAESVQRALVVPDLVKRLESVFRSSFANPLSGQGMLIFGAITSGWRLLL